MRTLVQFMVAKHADLCNEDKIPDGAIIVCEDVSRMYVKMHGKILPMTPKWTTKYTARKCTNCGAPLDNNGNFVVKCSYCGSVYDVDEERDI